MLCIRIRRRASKGVMNFRRRICVPPNFICRLKLKLYLTLTTRIISFMPFFAEAKFSRKAQTHHFLRKYNSIILNMKLPGLCLRVKW